MNSDTSKKIHQDHGASGAVVLFFIFLFIFAKWGPAIPFSVLSQSKGEPMVVIGQGKTTAIPDITKVSFGIQENGYSLKQTQDSVNKKSQSLVALLKSFGIEEKDIKTISYDIIPQEDGQNSTPNIIGYRINISYEVTIRDLDKVNEILASIGKSGGNIVSAIEFDLSDEVRAKAMDSARKDAVAKAKENAQSLAKASDVTLGKVINVTESQGVNVRPVYMAAKAMDLEGSAPVTPDVQPGTSEVTLTVSLSYEIR